MKEFKINKYLALKLERGGTYIYIKNEQFLQCNSLLLENPCSQIKSIDDLDSIDELTEKIRAPIKNEIVNNIPAEVIFWGHCSYLQLWYEQEYNTRLIHRNVAFPLLKRLAEIGDPLAEKVFQEEITKRLKSLYPPVVMFLLKESYLTYLNFEEILPIFGDIITIICKFTSGAERIYNFFELIELEKSTELIYQYKFDIEAYILDFWGIFEQELVTRNNLKKFNIFTKLVEILKRTNFIDNYKTQIEAAMSQLLIEFKNLSRDREKLNISLNILNAIKETEFFPEKIPDLLSIIGSFSSRDEKFHLFGVLLKIIEENNWFPAYESLIEKIISDIFIEIDSIRYIQDQIQVLNELLSYGIRSGSINSRIQPVYSRYSTNLVNDMTTMGDDEYIVMAFSELVKTYLKLDLIRVNIPRLLAIVKNVSNDSYKCDMYSDLLYSISSTDLMKVYFIDLKNIVDSISTFEKSRAFQNLLESVKGSDVIKENIEELLNLIETLQLGLEKRSIFEDFLKSINELNLMNEKFTVLLTFIESKTNNEDKKTAFNVLFDAIRNTRLEQENFSKLLITINNIKSSSDKQRVFGELLSTIRGTYLMRDNFLAILNSIKNISNLKNKIKILSAVVIYTRNTILMEEYKSQVESVFVQLLSSIENISDDTEKFFVICLLLTEFDGTVFIKKFYTQIKTTFSNLLSLGAIIDSAKDGGVRQLIRDIRDPELLKDFFVEFYSVIENWRDDFYNSGFFFILVNSIKKTHSIKEIYLRIKPAFLNLIREFEQLEDLEDKLDVFPELVSLFSETDMMKEVHLEFLAVVEKLQSSLEKIYSFSKLLIAIKRSNLLDEVYDRIEPIFLEMWAFLENELSGETRYNNFSLLLQAIRGTNILDVYYSKIELLFLEFLTAVKFWPEFKKGSLMFTELIIAIKGTPFIEEFLSELLVIIDGWKHWLDKKYAFKELLDSIKDTNLLNDKMDDIITYVEKASDIMVRYHSFFVIFKIIKETKLIENFSSRLEALSFNILADLDQLTDDQYKIEFSSALHKAIEEIQLLQDKK